MRVLQGAERVNIYFDNTNKRMALQPSPSGEWKYKPIHGYVRWNSKKLLNFMEEVAGRKLSGMRFLGEYFDEENVVIFDFGKSQAMRSR